MQSFTLSSESKAKKITINAGTKTISNDDLKNFIETNPDNPVTVVNVQETPETSTTKDPSLSVGAIIGIVVGGVVLIGVIIVLIIIFTIKRKKNPSDNPSDNPTM